ncbi:MAG: hypothetical protein ACJAVI_003156 [Candidatus Azotimanducaceae bacterium]|jgi:hypothetical protein
MVVEHNGIKIFEMELSESSPIYEKYGKTDVDEVLNSLRLTLPLVMPDYPYEARFLLWHAWREPVSHHCTLGNILGELVRRKLLPLKAGDKCGGTTIPYFFAES